ncbi:TIM-barrel domain-containing protein [Pseudochryseolinea flava]|uniref:Alpha-xylosidase n=1 Tax=Pseudochryseolinea flava TaxID=2059302 RepID=A0A364XYS9_9BACT|nr:TIM-barrel domain-containing protein [Pseudochryseolinea flava]RAV99481.1 alpha-xylosidase [Pseudochryseolinea flava]
MKRRLLAKIILCVLLLKACTPGPKFNKTDDGVIVHLSTGDAKVVQLKVISDKIIQVLASPVDSVKQQKSLIVLPESTTKTAWSVKESPDFVTVATAELQAQVSLSNGVVTFLDKTGNVLLSEMNGGGKAFTAAKIENENTYHIRQQFESPDDEAFYGLGGHQNGQMNYKGEDVELAQQNIVDVVPFLYSSKNYGILWDNYSITKFGDPRDYQSLNSLQLFDRNGKAGGLTADYYVGNAIKSSATEDKIEYEFLETPQVDSFPTDVARGGKVVWEGKFTSDKEGDHKFLVYASGYSKVWIDDELILDKWRQGWNPWTNKFTVNVKKDQQHKIKIEWTPDGGAYLGVRHLDPVTTEEQSRLSLYSEVGDAINYYFVKGDNADDVIHGYRVLTGKAPIVPKWAMGFWQSRERYRSQDEIISTVKEYRKRKIPLDNIVLDWRYWEDPKWGTHDFDPARFPNPDGMMKELHDNLHTQLMISVWPKFNKGTEHYEEMRKNGFLFMRNIEKKRKDWVGEGFESTFYDPFNDEAGKLFWKQIDAKLNSKGIDGWWLDATEPDMHSNISIEERKLNMSPTAIGTGTRYFNAYSLMNSKSVYEGQRRSSPDKRVFILTRSAYAGQQRYGAVTWSGDIVSRWSDLKDQISTGVNFSLSGIPYWTMDIGGFSVERRYENATGATLDEWRELNTRWFQFGSFAPIFRSHGQFPLREIYNISPEGHAAYNSMVYYTKLRYLLMPYYYSLAGKSYFDDYTIMRGLVMDFNHDATVRNIDDQFMCGSSLLINPVYTHESRNRKVYLPAQTGWYDLYSGKYFEGGQTITAEAPLERIPVFVKNGAILPVGPELQYTSEKLADKITLFVYAGADGSFDLYEDEGTNYNYEKGSYAVVPIKYNEVTKTLTIGERKGSFDGMLQKRTFNIVWVKTDHPVGLGANAQPQQVVGYEGKAVEIKMN